MTGSAPRIVLDTNAWLDLLLFDDPRVATLRAALHNGDICAVVNAACRAEWQRVLQYPQLQLDRDRGTRLSQAFDALACLLPDGSVRDPEPLPRCADRDDQKFVQLAFDSGARWLVSRDREVLALGRRTARAGWFEIVTPQAWSLAGTLR